MNREELQAQQQQEFARLNQVREQIAQARQQLDNLTVHALQIEGRLSVYNELLQALPQSSEQSENA